MGLASSTEELPDRGVRNVPFLRASALDRHGCAAEDVERWDRSVAGDVSARFMSTVVVNRLLSGTQTNLVIRGGRNLPILSACCNLETVESSMPVALKGKKWGDSAGGRSSSAGLECSDPIV